MFFAIYTFFIIFCLVINYKIFKKNINYLNIFLIIYYFAIVFSMSRFYGFSVPNDKLYIFVLIALISLEMFSIFFMAIKLHIKEEKKEEKVNTKILGFIALIIFVFMIPTTIEGIKIIRQYGFFAARSAAFSTEVYSSYTKIFLVYILAPLDKVVYMYALIDYIKTKKINIALIISSINILQMTVTLGGRSALLDFIIISIVIVYSKYNGQIIDILKNNKRIIAIAAIMMMAIVGVTNNRSIKKNEGFLFNVYSYYVGSIHLFNVHLSNPNISLLDGNHLLYGRGMLNPIEELTKMTLKFAKIKTDKETGIDIMNKQLQKFLTVRNGVKMNNNATFLYVCLRDFDFIGLIIGPAYIALWFVILYKLYIKKKSLKTDIMFFYIVSCIPYFLFEFYLNRTPTVLTFIYIMFLYKIVVSRKNKSDIKLLKGE